MRIRAAASIGLLLLAGCDDGLQASRKETSARAERIVARRAIEPESGRLSTAALDRSQIGSESRLVLSAQPRRMLR